jgi:hypothetical protein
MEQQIATQKLPLPGNEIRLQEVIAQVLRLKSLLELKITPNGLEVRRQVQSEEPVVPESIAELARGLDAPLPDLPFLLGRLELEELRFDPDRHPLHTVMNMFERVGAQHLHPTCWFVRDGDDLDAYVALPVGAKPQVFLGHPVHYVTDDALPEGKLLLVGSRTRQAIDAVYGVTADIGG